MRILYSHRTQAADGSAVHIRELVGALERAGHEVRMVGPDIDQSAGFGKSSGLVSLLRRVLPKAVLEVMELCHAWLCMRRLTAAAKAFQPDIVYERYNIYYPAAAWLKQRTGLPYLLEVNAPLYEERRRYDGLGLPFLARWSENKAWSEAGALLPVTMVLADRIRDRVGDNVPMTVIPNAIRQEIHDHPPDGRAVVRRYGLEAKIVLGFTGFMRAWHGLDRVIELIAGPEMPANLALLAVGDGPVRRDLEKQAAALGISDRVIFTGLVPRDEIGEHVAAFDIALQPDVTDYASPLKLFEYLSLGCAVIAPDRPNIREILTHEHNAVLFNPDAPDAMEIALDRLCQDQALRQRLSSAARATIEQKQLTWEANAARVIAIAEKLIADSSARA